MMGSAERERLSLLKTVAQSRKEIQVSYTLSAFGFIAWSEQHLYLFLLITINPFNSLNHIQNKSLYISVYIYMCVCVCFIFIYKYTLHMS